MKTHPNDAAFARPTDDYCSTNIDKIAQTGLTKREYFAAMALQGLLSYGDGAVEEAVKCADALIAELNKEQK